jgi:Ankyrin repeats (3 copies)/Ankyrin repeats (many copies)
MRTVEILRRGPIGAFAALVVCTYATAGCAAGCGDDDPGIAAAFQGAWSGDASAMRRLIAEKPDLANAGSCPATETLIGRLIDYGFGAGTTTVLHVAARQGHTAVVRVLLESGAVVDARDGEVATPLHHASQYGHDEVVALLLAANASVEPRRIGGGTPLHTAAAWGRYTVVKRLLAAGANPNVRSNLGWTPLHDAASEGRENVVRLLLDQGADPRAVSDQGATPARFAAQGGHREVVELLGSR